MRIIIDARSLSTAAHNLTRKAALVIELGRAGIWRLATSLYAAEEARRNIARKFPASLDRLETLLGDLGLVADAPDIPCPAGLAEKDRPILRAALGCRADVLLTGDLRDFGLLMNAPEKTGGLLIQTVAAFLTSR